MGIAAASSNETPAGFGARRDSRAAAYSAHAPDPGPEHLVARRERRHGAADGLDAAREVRADGRRRGPAEAAAPREEGARHAVPLDRVDGGCVHAHEHLVVLDRRLLDVPELEHVRAAVPFGDDRLHRVHPFRHGCVPVDRHGRHPDLLRHTL